MEINDIEGLLAVLEGRPERPAGRAEREAAMQFGADLNRLQGWQAEECDWRLIKLFVEGRMGRDELVRFIVEAAEAEAKLGVDA
ncbi:MAG: hypothetical protein KDE31_04960 [Caldilineaceae bacterium]|nr:hypothetical protein [Caldilineaceae bacterium]